MTAQAIQCSFCQAVNRPEESCCWMCWRPLGDARPVVEQRPPRAEHRSANTFGLSTLLIVIALAAVLLDVFRRSPGLGIALVLLLTPPALATLVESSRHAKSNPMSPFQKVSYFAVVFGVILGSIVVVGVAAFLAFLAVCGALI